MLRPFIINGVELTEREMMSICAHYETAKTQELILENPKMFGIHSEEEAWKIASETREVLDDQFYTGEDEVAAIEIAMKNLGIKKEKRNEY